MPIDRERDQLDIVLKDHPPFLFVVGLAMIDLCASFRCLGFVSGLHLHRRPVLFDHFLKRGHVRAITNLIAFA